MKTKPLVIAAGISCTAIVAHAAEDLLDRVVNLLQRVKASPKPLPNLKEAKQKFADCKPSSKALARGKRKQALNRDAKDLKKHAMELVNDAI